MKNIRTLIRQTLTESWNAIEEYAIEEERITNTDAAEEVKNKENFLGSHTYGEDLGELGLMYVAYSYGEEHPLYMWDGKRWYHNYDEYIKDDGTINTWTQKHLRDLRPNNETHGRPGSFMKKRIASFKKKHGIAANSHTDVPPGEK